MDYINPFSMVPSPQMYNTPNFMQVYQAQQQMNQAQPFIEMARRKQQEELMMQQLKAREFASPQAREMRSLDMQSEMAKHRANIMRAPVQARSDVLGLESGMRTLPAREALTMAETEDKTMQARGAGNSRMLEFFGNLYEGLEQAPPQNRPMLYSAALQQIQSRNPGLKIPPQFQQYNPEMLRLIRSAQVNTPQHAQNKALEGVKHGHNVEIEGIRGDRAREVAQISAGATLQANRDRIAADRDNDPKHARVKYNRIMNNPNATPEDREAAFSVLESLAKDSYDPKKNEESDPVMSGLRLRSFQGENVEAEVERRSKVLYERHLTRFGTHVKMKTPQGEIRLVPRYQLQEAKKRGYKEVN